MELEKKRGISVSSTVLQFDYDAYRINLLDTPGHRDFSEDTYRVLTAVDSVIMVLDAANGIESRTRKLFEVCRQRKVPIFTFINKLDRPTREPLELIDQLERELDLKPYPMNWPLGTGRDFRGVYDRVSKQVCLFERTPGGAYRAPEAVHGLDDPLLAESMDQETYERFVEEVQMLEQIGPRWDEAEVAAGHMTPVFFGSAMNNFGVQLLLDGFLRHSPPPLGRQSSAGLLAAEDPRFSGFVFKIQGNMDPRHRDRVAFLRVCSGRFSRDMAAFHCRTGKRLKLSNAHKLFGQEREIIDEAYAGDILGLVGYPDLKMGDTLSEDPAVVYRETPHFPAECFAFLQNPSPAKYKPFRRGLEQLLNEEVVQSFSLKNGAHNAVLLAAVGPLQFDVVQFRLESEYGVATKLEPAPWALARWLEAPLPALLPSGAQVAEDGAGQPMLLFKSEWDLGYFRKEHPGIVLHELSPRDRSTGLTQTAG